MVFYEYSSLILWGKDFTPYVNWFKAKDKVVGAVFQGRYKSILVEEETYAQKLSAYVHLNPIRAKLMRSPRGYRWSSFLDYVQLRTPDVVSLDPTMILSKNNRDVERRETFPQMREQKYGKKQDFNTRILCLLMQKIRAHYIKPTKGIFLVRSVLWKRPKTKSSRGEDIVKRFEQKIQCNVMIRELLNKVETKLKHKGVTIW